VLWRKQNPAGYVLNGGRLGYARARSGATSRDPALLIAVRS
jgi:hypothetical protein